MTLLIGLHLKTYVMLAADTRTIYLSPNGKILWYDDKSEKIQKTTMGLITGAGFKPLLDSVKERLRDQVINHTDQIIEIIHQETSAFLDKYHLDHESILNTGWLFSYITLCDVEPVLRLALIHLKEGSVIKLVPEGEFIVVMPSEATPEQAKVVNKVIQEYMRPSYDTSELEGSIRYHVIVIKEIVDSLHKIYRSISKSFQVGVQLRDGRTGISPIITNKTVNFNITLNNE